jgi:hypothetical protein
MAAEFVLTSFLIIWKSFFLYTQTKGGNSMRFRMKPKYVLYSCSAQNNCPNFFQEGGFRVVLNCSQRNMRNLPSQNFVNLPTEMMIKSQESNTTLSFEDYKKQILEDYKIIFTSRQTSILGRREVLNGKGTFGFLAMVKNYHKLSSIVSFNRVIFVRVTIEIRPYFLRKAISIQKNSLQPSMPIQISKTNPCLPADKWSVIFPIS